MACLQGRRARSVWPLWSIVLPFMLATDLAVVRLPLAIVTTKAYLQGRRRPRHPADLAEHVFVPVPPIDAQAICYFPDRSAKRRCPNQLANRVK